MKIVFVGLLTTSLFGLVASGAAATLTVTNSADSGAGTLRQAILDANADASPDVVTIAFAIPGAGVQTIAPLTPLPAITRPVTIDGYTQPGTSLNTLADADNAVLLIELSGTNAGASVYALRLAAEGCTVRGLVINNFTNAAAIVVEISGSNVIEGNFIGTDATGTNALANATAIEIGGAGGNRVGGVNPASRNLVCGNNYFGISLVGASNQVLGNFIGVGADGVTALPNGGWNMYLQNCTQTQIGGPTPGARNVISGTPNGCWVNGGGSNIIQGNFIGTDASGTLPRGAQSGIVLSESPNNLIGGTDAGAGNLISGNGSGVVVEGGNSSSNIVAGNRIGTDVTGTNALGNGFYGVYIAVGSGNVIGGTTPGAGNVISGNGFQGIGINGPTATGNSIQGNFIGTDVTGTNALGNATGIFISEGPGNRIGGLTPASRNIISGNQYGISLNVVVGTEILGNYLGLGADGVTAVANTYSGVFLHNCSQTQIGGSAPGARNVISGNAGGCQLNGGGSNVIQGNFIGTDASGTLARGNVSGLALSESSHNVIGGTDAGAGNLLSGNSSAGVNINGLSANSNVVAGNFIGTDFTGTNALGTGDYGVFIGGGSGNLIGGTNAGARNVISGNGYQGVAIYYGATGNVVQGNFIGTDVTGTVAVSNLVSGVVIVGSPGNLIGGTTAGAGNVIAFSTYAGVAITEDAATNNTVLGNSIFAIGGLGVDLAFDGVTPNDAGDADGSPNHFQNFPELASAVLIGGDLTVNYRVDSAVANAAYPLTVEFFLADSAASGEGRTLIHRHTYDTPQTFTNITFTPATPVNDGDPLVATATDANGNTSEFSAAATAMANRSPVVLNPIPDQNGIYGYGFSFILATNAFTDPDAGQTLTYTASNLPPGIVFDGPIRTFSGTNTDVGTNMVLVTATDDGSPPLSTNTAFQFVVNKAPLTITAENTSRAYGGFTFNFPLSYTGLVLNEQWWNLNFYPYAYSSADSTSPVGTYPITVSGGTDTHYEITLVAGTLTITNALLVVQGDQLCRPVGQTNPPITGTITGLQNNDNITANFATTATPASPLGDYPITVSSLSDPNYKLANYTVTQINGALHVVDFATDLQVLHSFGFTNLLGRSPQGRLIEGSDGILYGTAYRGGIAGIGVVFRINRDSTGYQVIHHFAAGGSAGAGPRAGVIEGTDGALYGTTLSGGSSNVGTVFKLNKDGSDFTVLREFTGTGGDGAAPGDLIQGTNHLLYGFTENGGSGNSGTLFQLSTNGGGYGVVHQFDFATEGYGPRGLSQGSDGMLYGATTYGGITFDGTVFKVNLDGNVLSVIHNFDGSTEGGNAAVREGSDQVLYGCAAGGGTNYSGTVFRLNRDGSGFAVLFTFPSYSNHGSNPKAEVVEGNDGALYGTTSGGGTNGSGTVFKLNKDGSGYTVLRHLGQGGYGGTDARFPFDALLKGSDGVLYGTSYLGGFPDPNDSGTLFRLNADGSGYDVLWRFSYGGGDGLSSQASLVEGSDGALYGTTVGGGAVNSGTVFRINKDGSGYQLLHSFSATGEEGMFPEAALLEGSNGRLYGSTRDPYPGGTLFSLNKDGSDFQVLYTFGSFGPDGAGRKSALVEGPGGVLFGVTDFGGTNSNGGTVFSIRLSGTAYSILRHSGFDETHRPQGVTLGSDGAIYVTAAGSSFPDGGSVFRLNQDGSGFQGLRTFGMVIGNGYTGAGAVVQATNGLLYGVTTYGGDHQGGTIFKMNLDGSDYAIVRSLGNGGHDAKYPTSGLVQGPDGALYGTGYSGVNGFGALFRITLDGTNYCVIHNFVAADGYGALSKPALVSGSDGALYGTADSGGVSGFGTIFKLSISPPSSNASPFVANFIPDQTNAYGDAFTYTFPINSFNDPDAGQVLSYGASGLPPGISFDAGTRTFSGTNTSAGSYSLTVTATDNGIPLLSTNDAFNFVVNKALLTVTANNTNRPYGEINPALTGTLVGVTNSDDLTASFTTTATMSSPPGYYPITPALQDPNSRLGNYIVTTNLGLLTVQGVTLAFNASGGSLSFCWPTTAAAFVLEYADDLTPPVAWQSVTSGITTNAPNICLTVAPEVAVPSRFYRLRLP